MASKNWGYRLGLKLLLLLLCILPTPIFSQYPAVSNIRFPSQNYREVQRVDDICNFRGNRIFIATPAGLSELRGKSILTFDLPKLDSSLSREVFFIEPDQNKRIWFATYPSGWGYFDPDSKQIVNLTLKGNFPLRRISAFLRDKKNRLWLGSWNENEKNESGLYLADENGNRLKKYQFAKSETENDRQNSNLIQQIGEDVKGNLWLATWEGLIKFNPQTEKFETIEASGYGNPKIMFTSLTWVNDSILLAGTWGNGLLQLNINSHDKKWFRIHNFNSFRGTHNIILSIAPAKPNLFLCASLESGLYWFDFASQNLIKVNGSFGPVPSHLLSGTKYIHNQSNGDILIGTSDQGLIYINHRELNNRYYFFPKIDNFQHSIFQVYYHKKTEQYIACTVYGNCMFGFDKKFKNLRISAKEKNEIDFLESALMPDNNYLIRTSAGNRILNPSTFKFINFPNNLPESLKKSVKFYKNYSSKLLGTEFNDSVYFYNLKNEFIHASGIKEHRENASGSICFLDSSYILSVNNKGRILLTNLKNKKNTITIIPEIRGIKKAITLPGGDFLVINFEGIFRLNISPDGKIKSIPIPTQYSKVSSHFQNLFFFKGRYIATSEYGIVEFFPKVNSIRTINFPDEAQNYRTCLIPETGELAFCASNKLIIESFLNTNLAASKDNSYIQLIRVNQETFQGFIPKKTKKIELEPGHNFIDLEFGNILPIDEEKYMYQLSEVDLNPKFDLNENRASYSNLEPGTYTFTLWSINPHNQKKELLDRIEITLNPFWYQHWLFKLSILAALGLLLFLFLHYRHNILQREFSLRRQMLEADLKALRSQMNPHFIFNSLNSINRYIIKNDPVNASDYLSKFARLIRMILDHSNEKTIPISKEIQFLNYYLDLEQIRLNNAFAFQIEIDTNVDSEQDRIQPMLLQPFLENAIWHGIMNKPEKNGILTIRFSKENELLQVEIRDNGVGRKQAALHKPKRSSASLGIQLTQNRLQLLDPQSKIDIIDLLDQENNPTGTCVVIQFKISSLHD